MIYRCGQMTHRDKKRALAQILINFCENLSSFVPGTPNLKHLTGNRSAEFPFALFSDVQRIQQRIKK